VLQPLAIPSLLRLPERKLCITVREQLPDLPLLTPVQGEIEIQHQGTCLQVSARVNMIVTLTCRHVNCLDTQQILDVWVELPPEVIAQVGQDVFIVNRVPGKKILDKLSPVRITPGDQFCNVLSF